MTKNKTSIPKLVYNGINSLLHITLLLTQQPTQTLKLKLQQRAKRKSSRVSHFPLKADLLWDRTVVLFCSVLLGCSIVLCCSVVLFCCCSVVLFCCAVLFCWTVLLFFWAVLLGLFGGLFCSFGMFCPFGLFCWVSLMGCSVPMFCSGGLFWMSMKTGSLTHQLYPQITHTSPLPFKRSQQISLCSKTLILCSYCRK